MNDGGSTKGSKLLEKFRVKIFDLGQIFFVLIRNLPANVTRILSKFDSNGGTKRKVVNPQSRGSLRSRSAEATELKNENR